MKRYALVLIGLLQGVTSVILAGESRPDLSYKVAYVQAPQPLITVDLSWKSDENGWLNLKFENSSWGDADIYDCIQHFEVFPVPESIVFDRDSSLVKIRTLPHTDHRIRYAITQDFTESLKNHHRYRPIVTDTYFHLLGMRLFMFPVGLFPDAGSKASLHISWASLPGNGIFHSSFGPEYDQWIEVTQEELYASFFVGGDFRRYTFTYRDKPVYFLTRGNWESLTDAGVLQILREAVSTQYAFWNDTIDTMFSVTLIPTTEQNSYSIGGSGLTDSFISFASNNPASTPQRITWLYNHELLHKWMGRTIKNENEVEQYWFSEGFTDYYAYKLMLKNDRLDVSEFVRWINEEVVTPHYANKEGISTTPNADLTFQTYWSQYGVYGKLPYRRGFLYAFFLDNRIREGSKYTKSLDNLMLDILGRTQADPEFRISAATFLNVLDDHGIPGAESDFKRYIEQGELIEFGVCLPEGLTFETREDDAVFVMDAGKSALVAQKLKR